MVEKELGERNFGFDSLKSRLKSYMEEKGIVAVCGSVHFGSLSFLRRYIVPTSRSCADSYGGGVVGGVQPEESAYDRGSEQMERLRNDMDLK